MRFRKISQSVNSFPDIARTFNTVHKSNIVTKVVSFLTFNGSHDDVISTHLPSSALFYVQLHRCPAWQRTSTQSLTSSLTTTIKTYQTYITALHFFSADQQEKKH